MKIWFWLLLSIIVLMVGCASSYERRPANQADISDYWSRILYNQPADQR
jgi:outer membrane biogenesis lipoprotein LolB